jgi:magnesium transporter
MRADYLAYALIDAVTDQYFPIIESLGESLDNFHRAGLHLPTQERVNELHEFRGLISRIQRAVLPQRDLLGHLMRDESGLIAERTKPYFRDCYDNTVLMLDFLDSFRDSTRNSFDLYLMSTSLRTNEMVRVLTIVASLFIPLTFIAGMYWMNFDPKQGRFHMPVLEWPFGYLFAICLMLSVTIAAIAFFKRKKWL